MAYMSMCPDCGRLGEWQEEDPANRIAALKSENADLRRRLAEWEARAIEFAGTIDRLTRGETLDQFMERNKLGPKDMDYDFERDCL